LGETARLDAGQSGMNKMEEREFFSGEEIYVSLTRFVAFGKTYAMSGVTSVGAVEAKPDHSGSTLTIALGALCILIGLAFTTFLIIGVVLIAAACYLRSTKTPDHYVMLTTSAGQVQAVRSKDKEYIGSIVKALNDCIVARG
jgi:hypothetical protein